MGVQRTKLRTFWASVGLAFCGSLLVLSVPRLVGSLYALYPETLLKQHSRINDDFYRKAISELDVALSWHNTAHYWQHKALCYLALYHSPSATVEEKTEALTQAQLAIEHGLALSPIDPFSWFKLSEVRDLAGSANEPIQSAYQLSLYAGRVEPEILISRLNFGLAHLNGFDYATNELWLKQIPIAYQLQASELVKLAVHNPTLKTFVLAVFLFQNEKLTQFNHAFEIANKKNLNTTH